MSLSSLLADSLTSTLNTAGLLIADSAIKGALLLTIASVVAWALRRDSAATRHWVWLVAVLSLLAIPTMSVVLPQWRVLPAWLTIEPRGNQGVIPSNNLPRPSLGQAKTMTAQPYEHEPWPVPDPTAPIASLPDESFDNQPLASPATLSQPMAVTASNQSWNWQATLAGCWSVGCIWLSLRLLFARALLGQASRGAVVIGKLHRQTVPACSEESLNYAEVSTAFKDACWQLGIKQPVTLLIHSQKTIPIVWGIWQPRLMLPAIANQWSTEQLRSVLLHELAHIQRRDTLSQLLTQIACALHWFNPLVWVAAWRLHVERERACDDLVLASGVRASAYAEHLLSVATRLTASSWTQACGLAMASRSSLPARITAVLDARQNRRNLTKALLVSSLIMTAVIVIPVAMLSTASEAVAVTANAEPSLSRSLGRSLSKPRVRNPWTQRDCRRASNNISIGANQSVDSAPL